MKWYYKLSGNKLGKLLNEVTLVQKGKTEADMIAEGRTIAATNMDIYKVFKACGQEADASKYGVDVTPEELILEQSVFLKLDIRRAMRAMPLPKGTQEDVLDAILSKSAIFAKDWSDATDINLDDPMVKQALAGAGLDINAIKLKILELKNSAK
jgi:hypothetical protein